MQAVDKNLEHFWVGHLVEVTSTMISTLQQQQEQRRGVLREKCQYSEFFW